LEEQVSEEAIADTEEVRDETECLPRQVVGPASLSHTPEDQLPVEQAPVAAVEAKQDETASQDTDPTSTYITFEVPASEEPTKVARAVSLSPQSRKGKETEPASQVVEGTSASAFNAIEEEASDEPSETFGMEEMQDETANPTGLIADPISTSLPSQGDSLEGPSAIADAEDAKDETASPATQVAGATSTSDTSEVPASEELLEDVRPISPPPKPKKKKKEPAYWQTLSVDDITSIIVESVTPEKGLRQLDEEADADIIGFAASRLASGLIEGGKAAFFSVKAAAGEKTEATAVAAASKATQKLVSALAAVTALGCRGAGRAQEYAQKLQTERIEAAKKAAEARKVEEERKRIEAERIAAEKVLVDEAMAAEEVAEKEIQARVDEVELIVVEESTTADEMAGDIISGIKETIEEEIGEIQVDKTSDAEQVSEPSIFFADEI
jgi:hypothetical protein